MKLRIRDNSIRMRLERAEVGRLLKEGLVSANTRFPGGRSFVYQVESSPASVKPEAFFSESTMTIRLPETDVLGWCSTNQVSMAGDQHLDDGETLGILVEKDFACLAPREGEDESDMYPHPQAEPDAG